MRFVVFFSILFSLQLSKASQQPEVPSFAKIASCYYPPEHEPREHDPAFVYYNYVKAFVRNRKTDFRILLDSNLREEKLRFEKKLPNNYVGVYYSAFRYTLSKDINKSAVHQTGPAEDGWLYYRRATFVQPVTIVHARQSMRNILDVEQFEDDNVPITVAVPPLLEAHLYLVHTAHTADPPKDEDKDTFLSDAYFPTSIANIPKIRPFGQYRVTVNPKTCWDPVGLIEQQSNLLILRPDKSQCEPPNIETLEKLSSRNIVFELLKCICDFHRSLSKQWAELVIGRNGFLAKRAIQRLAKRDIDQFRF